MNRLILFLLLITFSLKSNAQCVLKAIIKNKNTLQPIENVAVSETDGKHELSNNRGFIQINNLKAGKHLFSFIIEGYEPLTLPINLPDSTTQQVILKPKETDLEEVVVIASTRNNTRIEDSPMKVEVLGKEEMNEENTIKPENIASILGDVSGIQIQQSSAVSGNANIRIQGLEGRYTQLLRDGMPLYDGFSGGFGVIQIPPLDLKQIELIKGCTSTLYGSGAIGGLINLISRQPSEQQEATVTLNQTTLQETNVNTYVAKRFGKIGYTFYTGLNHHTAKDINKDGFSDVPKLNSIVVHPRIFLFPNEQTSLTLGYTGTFEQRLGGDMQVLENATNELHQYFEKNANNRNSGELSFEHWFNNHQKLTVKGSLSSFTRAITENDFYFKGRQLSYYTEATVFIPLRHYSLVAGINLTSAQFKKLPSDEIHLNNYVNNTIGVFTQFTASFNNNSMLELGLRADHQNNYGNFLLPRLALFYRFNEIWATRLGVGFSYKSPDPLTPQNIDFSIQNILPLPNDIKAEKSIGYNAEVNFKKELGPHSSVFINQAFFLTKINTPVIATINSDENVVFNNMDKPIITKGFDTYIQLQLHDWEIYTGYTFTIAERKYLNNQQFLPLTPKNRAAFTLVRELENKWRFGVEGSYTGSQYRYDESKTPGYMFMAAMIERKLGRKVSLVLNAENLLDYKQSNAESLYTGTVTNPVFKPLWAPIDGRVINLNVRLNAF